LSTEIQPTFRRSISLPSSGLKEVLLCQLHAGFSPGLFFNPEDGGDVPPKRRLTSNGLHGAISQKPLRKILKYEYRVAIIL
jgi:hypothetical protein